MDNNHEEFIGVDYGAARVGLARGSTAARLAQPLKTVPAAVAIDVLSDLAASLTAAGIVVGLPRSLEGNETEQTETVRKWADTARAKIDLPFYWQDEALTSAAAAKSDDIDAAAAAAILQDFLDTPKQERVRC